jgi:hypothetical protein
MAGDLSLIRSESSMKRPSSARPSTTSVSSLGTSVSRLDGGDGSRRANARDLLSQIKGRKEEQSTKSFLEIELWRAQQASKATIKEVDTMKQILERNEEVMMSSIKLYEERMG